MCIFTTAVAMWPVEERLSKVLGSGQGLKGQIGMRFALESDVKARGARNKSQYYLKHRDATHTDHNSDANNSWSRGAKRRRDDGEWDDGDDEQRYRPNKRKTRAQELADLDAELDQFNAGDVNEPKASNGSNGDSLASRLGSRINDRSRVVAPLPRRRGKREGGSDTTRRFAIDKDALDAELDAFVNERND
jgi:hypothetical protein